MSRDSTLQAYHLARNLGPLEQWEGTAPTLLAGRIASQLGGDRLSRRLFRRAWRQDRTQPEARYYRARVRLERSGPLAAWELLDREGDLPEAAPALEGMWFGFRATVAAHLRDFDAADAWLSRAEQMSPADPWLAVERAMVLEQEDRYEEALSAARQSLALHPWFRPGVQALAHLLQLLNCDEEALALLTDAAGRLESPAVLGQLTLVQTELGRWEEARRSLDRFEALAPLADEAMTRWLAAQRSDVAYHCGDLGQAIDYARRAGDPFHQALAEQLENAGCGAMEMTRIGDKYEPTLCDALAGNPQSRIPHPQSRVLLPVGFVRQRHMTCVPATLSTLSRFWSMPADHLEVAEAICYDGTPDHSERTWAKENGWVAREFTVTWESATALLDRGVPFTLVTADPTNAHLQAVIGYDRRRGTLLLRDPYVRHHTECLAEEGLKALRSTGPRGMALVPSKRAELLEGLELPDAPLYDRYYQLQRALVRHDRPEAQRLDQLLQEAAPDHRLTLLARRSLAAYDSDPTELLACAERLLELYPDDGGFLLLKLGCLRDLARRDERLSLLKEVCARKGSHPVFRSQYAQELAPTPGSIVRRSACSAGRCGRSPPTAATSICWPASSGTSDALRKRCGCSGRRRAWRRKTRRSPRATSTRHGTSSRRARRSSSCGAAFNGSGVAPANRYGRCSGPSSEVDLTQEAFQVLEAGLDCGRTTGSCCCFPRGPTAATAPSTGLPSTWPPLKGTRSGSPGSGPPPSWPCAGAT